MEGLQTEVKLEGGKFFPVMNFLFYGGAEQEFLELWISFSVSEKGFKRKLR